MDTKNKEKNNISCYDEPGHIREPYYIPGYTGHIPTMQYRHGTSFGRASRRVLEDPSVPLAPIPVLLPPGAAACGKSKIAYSSSIQHRKQLPKNSRQSLTQEFSRDTCNNSSPSRCCQNVTEKSLSECNGTAGHCEIHVGQLPHWAPNPPFTYEAYNEDSSIRREPYGSISQACRGMLQCIPRSPECKPHPRGANMSTTSTCQQGHGPTRTGTANSHGGSKDETSTKSSGKLKSDTKKTEASRISDTNQDEPPAADSCNVQKHNTKSCSSSESQEQKPQENSRPIPASREWRPPVLNRSPYVQTCPEGTDTKIFRPSESLPPAYTGHVPGFIFRSDGQSFGKVSSGTTEFMCDNYMYPIRPRTCHY